MLTQSTYFLNRAVVFATSVLVSVSSALSATVTMNPTMDALVTTGPSGNLANNNYGGAGSISVSAPGLEMGEQQAVLQFNLGGAVSAFDAQFGAGQWSIESISLRLTSGNANNPIFNSPAAGAFGISWMQNDSWLEGIGTPAAPGATGITFSSLQSTFMSANDQNLGSFTYNGSTSGSSTYTLGLSSGLLGDISSGDNVSLRLFAEDSTVSGVFSSRNFGTAGNRPVLTMVAVPEPAAIAMLGIGLTLALLWRKRR